MDVGTGSSGGAALDGYTAGWLEALAALREELAALPAHNASCCCHCKNHQCPEPEAREDENVSRRSALGQIDALVATLRARAMPDGATPG